MFAREVKVDILKDNEHIDLSTYNADFFGYDVTFGNVTPNTYPTHYGLREHYIGATHGRYQLMVSFFVETLEDTLALAKYIDCAQFTFSDSTLIFDASISEYSYDCINGNTYQLDITYLADIYSSTIKKTLDKLETTYLIDSPTPTFVTIVLEALENIDEYTFQLEYYDSFYLKTVKTKFKINQLKSGDKLVIDSKNLKVIKNGVPTLQNIEMDLFPIMNNNLKIDLQNNKMKVRIDYERRY